MTRIIIKRLCEVPEWAAQCHAWDEAEWPRDPSAPNMVDFFADHYTAAAKNHGATLPQTFIALRGDKIIGMLSLIAEDHPDLLHLTPWIASGFVVPSERGSRAFYDLVKTAILFAHDILKQQNLYFYSLLRLDQQAAHFMCDVRNPFIAQASVMLYRCSVPQALDAIKRS